MGPQVDSPTLAAKRRFTVTFGTGLLLITVTLFLHSKTVIDVLKLVGMGLQLWGFVDLWHSRSSEKKRLRNAEN